MPKSRQSAGEEDDGGDLAIVSAQQINREPLESIIVGKCSPEKEQTVEGVSSQSRDIEGAAGALHQHRSKPTSFTGDFNDHAPAPNLPVLRPTIYSLAMDAEERSDDSQRDDGRDKWQDAIRVKPESQKRWDVIKVILRAFTLAFAIALAVLCIRSVRIYDNLSSASASLAFVGCLTPASISGIWALAEFITIFVRTSRSGLRLTGIPPGAHVAVDLLLWLTSLVFVALLSVWLIYILQSAWYFIGLTGAQMGIALAALCLQFAMTGLHFTLFVRACIETERRNSERRIKKAIMSLSQRGLDLASTSYYLTRRSHALSTLPPESVIEERPNRPPESPIPPDRRRDTEADVEAEMRIEDNVKFIMPASLIKEMTDQKYTMMGPADGEQKYPGLRRGER
ncbi:hypothetical protein DL764_007669 [Monosporascus ibericus]|uniref:Uncharacterized protein n=1 Tax=Monosporascus ibericus TaxID=155417 RepID=A0A4Q4T1J1_9PEZI|nr:hypothetical protein DL764_007669 [Monosporascus ibericus]